MLEPKIVLTDDVRSAARHLKLRTVDAAVIYQSDVKETKALLTVYTFPENTHDPIQYVGVVTNTGTMRKAGLTNEMDHPAPRFLSFLASPAAASLWHKHGFGLPPGAGDNQ